MGRREVPSFSQARVLVPFYLWLVVFCLVIFQISYSGFERYEIDDCIEYAKGINSLVIDTIDPNRVDEYLRDGRAAPGYNEVEAKLYKLRAAYPDVEFLYVYQFQPDGCHVVFDLDTPEVDAPEPGTVVAYDQSFSDEVPKLLAGEPLEPLITNDHMGRLLTVYTPVHDASGRCVCYVAVDFSMGSIRAYVMDMVLHMAAFALVFVALSALLGYLFTRHQIVEPMKAVESKAYRDELTGVRNKAAFVEHMHMLDADISEGVGSFALLMVDINFLKRVNDNYGHERGDEYLCASVEAICSVFGHDRVYRTGGDEFVVLLERGTLAEAQELRAQFKAQMMRMAADEELPAWRKVSAAVGVAVYDAAQDRSVEDVLKRADAAMYEDKKAMKAERRD